MIIWRRLAARLKRLVDSNGRVAAARLIALKTMVEKELTAKEPELIKYLVAVRRMEKHFAGFTFCHIPRSKNVEADELAKAAAQRATMPADVFYQELSVKAI